MRTYYLGDQPFASASVLGRKLVKLAAGEYRVRISDTDAPRPRIKTFVATVYSGGVARHRVTLYAHNRSAAGNQYIKGSRFMGMTPNYGARFETPGGANFYITSEG